MGGVRRLLVSYKVSPTLPALLAEAYLMALQEESCESQSNNYGVVEPASQREKPPRSVAVARAHRLDLADSISPIRYSSRAGRIVTAFCM